MILLWLDICNHVGIMYLGKIVEMSDAEKIVYEPLHLYTKALIVAVPIPDPNASKSEAVIKGEIRACCTTNESYDEWNLVNRNKKRI